MLVPQTAEYALRAMVCLAALNPNELITVKKLSEQSNVPAHYLSKILHRLVVAGLVQSQKGPGGGVGLKKTAAQIRYIDIFHALDFQPKKRHCAFGRGQCDEKNPCPLHNSWSKLEGEFFRWAERTTLRDTL